MKVFALVALALLLQLDGCTPDKPVVQTSVNQESASRRQCSASHRFTNADLNEAAAAADACACC